MAPTLSHILKYNPFHDELGLFATEGSAKTVVPQAQGEVLLHGTTEESFQQILASAFKSSEGGAYGSGVYTTPNIDTAKYFGKAVLQMRLARGVKTKKFASDQEYEDFAFGPEVKVRAAELKAKDPKITGARDKAVHELLSEEGFGAHRISRDNGDYIIVHDPKHLVAVQPHVTKAEPIYLAEVPEKSSKGDQSMLDRISTKLVIKDEDPSTPEQRLVFCEVYAPMRPDADGEFMTAEEIQKMAHDFVRAGRLDQVDVDHDNQTVPGVQIVESFIARKGDSDFIEGSWVVGIHVNDDDTWEKVKKGELNGLSMEALVIREEQEVTLEVPPVLTGSTMKSEGHTHTFHVFYVDGKFAGGVTNSVDGHCHQIRKGTITEEVDGHFHKFSHVDDIQITK